MLKDKMCGLPRERRLAPMVVSNLSGSIPPGDSNHTAKTSTAMQCVRRYSRRKHDISPFMQRTLTCFVQKLGSLARCDLHDSMKQYLVQFRHRERLYDIEWGQS